jgi:uncharacterized repeat protein (TIGR01451 family)
MHSRKKTSLSRKLQQLLLLSGGLSMGYSLLAAIAPSKAFAGNLEFSSGSYPSPPNGPTTADQTATFLENTTEPNIFGAYTPTITLKASISNQQYTNGLVFGDTIAAPVATFRQMNVIATPANNMFTANPTGTPGTQVSIADNYAFEMFTNVDQLTGQDLNGKFYYADLTLTFSRPVTDPVIHMTGMGGAFTPAITGAVAHGHSAEFEFITPGITASKLSGSPNLNVALNGSGNYDITNSATTLGATCPAVGGSSASGGACGSVKFTGTNITELKFKVYVRGDGQGTAWSTAGTHAGDVFLFGGASFAKPVTVSGTIFNDANGLVDSSINGTGSNAGGLFANLLDSSGKVVASTAVAANGTYSFLAIGAGNYRVSLSTTAGVQGTPAPTIALPSGWNSTGEGTAAAGDGTVDGKTDITVAATNITGINFGIQPSPVDRSDAPVSGTAPNGTGTNSYGEATHTVIAGTRLGTGIDSDAAAIANATASGDGSDDDGISSFPTLNPGATSYSIPAANIAATGTGTMHAWIDFNKDGLFSATEYQSVSVTNGTVSGPLNWTGITVGSTGNTFARFRFTSSTLTDNTGTTTTDERAVGLANDGEVEDYQMAIAALPIDYGDAPQDLSSIDASLNPAYPTLLANSGARHTMDGVHYLGTGVTGDTNGQPTINADGDAQDDGVTFPTTGSTSILSVGQSNSITVNASTTGVLNAWIDWNQNGLWEASEQIATNQAMSAGNNSITVTPGDTAPHGKTYARFRFSTQSNLQPSGAATDGEVEDYAINVVIPEITTCTAPLMNAGFEFPKISGATPTPIQFYPNIKLYKEADVPGWAAISNNPNATFSQIAVISPFNQRNAIELWGIGNSYNVQPYEGQQFAEINAYVFGRLYQDLITIPGSKMRWQFAHRGRDGSDTIRVKFGAPGATTDQGTYTTARTGWQVYTGSYTIPAGQTITRFEFEAVSSATGDTAQGNFIDDIQFGIDCPKPNNPNVLLVKRITAINGGTSTLGGDSLAGYIDASTNPYDDNTLTIPTQNTPADPAKDTANWPPLNTFMLGGINGGNIKPNDEVEYSIYFLSAGLAEAKNVLFCDRVPEDVSYIFNSFGGSSPLGLTGTEQGMQLLWDGTTRNLTNVPDADVGQYFAPGIDPKATYPNINCRGANTNGAVVVNLGNLPHATAPGIPTKSYGFIRFRGRVK